jgi:deoxyribodipyrimidine photo-lyase
LKEPQLVHETHAEAIFFNRGTDPYSSEIQKQLEIDSEKRKIRVFSYKDITIFEPNEVLTRDGRPFRVFTPYAKAWLQKEKPMSLPKISRLYTPPNIPTLPLPTLGYWELTSEAEIVEAGEKAARSRISIAGGNSLFIWHTFHLTGHEAGVTAIFLPDSNFGFFAEHLWPWCKIRLP